MTVNDERFDEERFITIDIDAISQVLVVVYKYGGKEIRLTSARKAILLERIQYEEK